MTAPAVRSFQGSGAASRYARWEKLPKQNSPSTTKDRYVGSSESPRFLSFCPRRTDRRIKLERLLYRLNEMKWQISDKTERKAKHITYARRAYVYSNETCAFTIKSKQEPRLTKQYVVNKKSKFFVSRCDLLSYLSDIFVKIRKKTKYNLMEWCVKCALKWAI